ncbi:MAG: type I phosphomannose isomerase catalytic subunit [Phycisphaerales bacterium]
MEMYPLKSVPVFKSRIWGGQTLRDLFGKELPAGEKIGESWEIADLPEGKSTIGNGPLQGQTLGEAVRQHTEAIAGVGDFPKSFPLLIKLLDAQQVLSVQVHPDAETCRRMGKGDMKTECWYIIQAKPGAVIYKGFKKPVTREQFAKAIREGTAADLLAAVPVSVGECHFIPAGTAHAIGTGLLVAEVQTPSDTTYRVFDWNRVDDSGKPRQLHIEEALESIHFDITPDKLPVTRVGRLVDCDYFKVDKGHRAEGGEVYLPRGVMRVLIVLTGGGAILSRQAEPVDFAAGDSLVIPAAFEGAMKFDHDTEYLVVTV